MPLPEIAEGQEVSTQEAEVTSKRTNRKIEDALAYYRENYAGLTRGELQTKDRSLYQKLRREGLIDQVPVMVSKYGTDPLEYYREHYDGMTRKQLRSEDFALYQTLYNRQLHQFLPKDEFEKLTDDSIDEESLSEILESFEWGKSVKERHHIRKCTFYYRHGFTLVFTRASIDKEDPRKELKDYLDQMLLRLKKQIQNRRAKGLKSNMPVRIYKNPKLYNNQEHLADPSGAHGESALEKEGGLDDA